MRAALAKKSWTLLLRLIVNFGEDMMKRGITRTVNGLPE